MKIQIPKSLRLSLASVLTTKGKRELLKELFDNLGCTIRRNRKIDKCREAGISGWRISLVVGKI